MNLLFHTAELVNACLIIVLAVMFCFPSDKIAVRTKNIVAALLLFFSGIFITIGIIHVEPLGFLSTNFALFCVGCSLLFCSYKHRILLYVFQSLILAITFASFGTYFLNIADLYDWHWFKPVPLPMATVLLALSAALWWRWGKRSAKSVRAAAAEGSRIVILGAALLTIMGSAAGMVGFGVFMNYQESATGNQLISSVVSLSQLYDTIIEEGLAKTDLSIAQSFQDNRFIEAGRPEDAQHLAESLLLNGFSSVRVQNNRNQILAGAGTPVTDIVESIALKQEGVRLVYSKESYFVLQAEREISERSGRVIGKIFFEQQMPRMTDSYFNVAKLGKTADSMLCSQAAPDLAHCLPTVLTRRLITVTPNNKTAPISDALAGQTGARRTTDYRSKPVIAAYSPVGQTGLGLTLKMDVVEIYAPIRALLERVLVILAVLLLVGVVVLQKIMAPVVKRIVDSQQVAEDRAVQTQAIVDHVYDGIVSINDAGQIETFNKACEEIFGFSADEVVGQQFRVLAAPEFKPVVDQLLLKRDCKTPTLPNSDRHEITVAHRTGREVYVEIGMNEIHNAGRITYVGIVHNVTESRIARRALQTSESRLRTITDNVPAGIAYFDHLGRVLFANKIYAQWLGADIAEMMNQPLLTFLNRPQYQQDKIHVDQVLAGLDASYEHLESTDEGNFRATQVSYLADRTSTGQVKGFFALITDITERKSREEALTHLANHDSLTGLPNRRLFYDRIEQAMLRSDRHQHAMALFTLDIDHFKKINDTMGHDVGDELLKTFGKRLQNFVRDSDTVARMGGDEFTIIMDDVSNLNALKICAQALLTVIREPVLIGQTILPVTSSIGIAVYHADDISIDGLLKSSDTALYKAKENGRDCYHIEHHEFSRSGSVRGKNIKNLAA